MNKLTFLSIKDIMRILNCSRYIAAKIRKDVSEEYAINQRRITYLHLAKYLKLEE